MQFAYLVAAILFVFVWIMLFILRKDLRREMLTMSLLAVPLGIVDIVAVPLWWKPTTLFGLPLGIEGIIYTFCLGGIASVIYAELSHKRLQHIHKYHKSAALIVFTVTAAIFLPLAIAQFTNPVILVYIALLSGLGITLYFRKDLVRGTLVGASSFGVLYFALIKAWFSIYPEAAGWFIFQGLPSAYLWGVPIWELLFGMIFAAYWGNIYAILFGYKLVGSMAKKK